MSRIPSARTPDHAKVGLDFCWALASRDYEAAYAMTATEYQRRTSLAALRGAFDPVVPLDWGSVGPIEVGHVMETWPDKQPSDMGWAYISFGGDLYSEAVTVVVMLEADSLKIRSVEFGRP